MADGLGLGLEVSLQEAGRGLLVERLEPGGVAEAWNRRCAAEADAERAIRPGDTILSVNESQGAEAMLREFETRWLMRLTLARGAPPTAAVVEAPGLQGPPAASPGAVLRPDAPEFLPERMPLQSRQLPVIPEDADPSASEAEAECVPVSATKAAAWRRASRRAPDGGGRGKENVAAPRA
mmetsp:Transcript_70455/g.210070  ORF Transcript_70455/g.210070 Transcript_70455/m.210070 type:complete len:180 (+) Transcript_70455:1-540(+)